MAWMKMWRLIACSKSGNESEATRTCAAVRQVVYLQLRSGCGLTKKNGWCCRRGDHSDLRLLLRNIGSEYTWSILHRFMSKVDGLDACKEGLVMVSGIEGQNGHTSYGIVHSIWIPILLRRLMISAIWCGIRWTNGGFDLGFGLFYDFSYSMPLTQSVGRQVSCVYFLLLFHRQSGHHADCWLTVEEWVDL